jgi:TolB-like protein
MVVEAESCSPAEARTELHRILSSAHFNASERNRRFLEYVVEETLAGRARRIKAYSIAIDVFGRGPNFDPQFDPVVRMEARRIRRSLERFYLLDRETSPVRIVLPKGAYIPEFQSALQRLEERVPQPANGDRSLAIRVAQFETEGDQSAFPNLDHGLTRQIVLGLVQIPNFVVFVADRYLTPDHEASHAKPDFILTGGVCLFGGVLSVTAVFLDGRTGKVAWSENFESSLPRTRRPQASDVVGARDEVANCIVRALQSAASGRKKEALEEVSRHRTEGSEPRMSKPSGVHSLPEGGRILRIVR